MKRKVEKKLSLGRIKIASLNKTRQGELKGGIRTIDAACQGNTTPVSVCPCLSTGTAGNLCTQDICRF